jgi:hypothetical protein
VETDKPTGCNPWACRFPPPLAERLQQLLDNPNG